MSTRPNVMQLASRRPAAGAMAQRRSATTSYAGVSRLRGAPIGRPVELSKRCVLEFLIKSLLHVVSAGFVMLLAGFCQVL